MSVEEQLVFVREQVEQEKAGKRKLFHSLVKVASELRRVRDESEPLLEQRDYADKNWYDGGIWRAPTVLPGVFAQSFRTSRLRESFSLKDLFFGLTIVTAYTRVGVAISKEGFVDVNSLLYFAVFWSVSGKEASYSTRFDTTDLSAQAVTLVTCFAVLFASLSVQQPINSIDGTRVMVMAAFVAALHILLYARVLVAEHWSGDGGDDNDADKDEDNNSHTRKYRTATSFGSTEVLAEIKKEYRPKVRTFSIFSLGMCLCELLVWIVGIFAVPSDWPHRWIIFLGGILLAFRVPRSFLPSDFHGMWLLLLLRRVCVPVLCLLCDPHISLFGSMFHVSFSNSFLLQTRCVIHSASGILTPEYHCGGKRILYLPNTTVRELLLYWSGMSHAILHKTLVRGRF